MGGQAGGADKGRAAPCVRILDVGVSGIRGPVGGGDLRLERDVEGLEYVHRGLEYRQVRVGAHQHGDKRFAHGSLPKID